MSGNPHHAFIAFLRCEASAAEERAKSLRATALSIEANLPKSAFLGDRRHKRGSTAVAKRGPTAYGVFVKENYALIKNSPGGSNLSHADITSAISRQWAATSEEEKQLWKDRATAEKEALEQEEDEDEDERKKRARATGATNLDSISEV